MTQNFEKFMMQSVQDINARITDMTQQITEIKVHMAEGYINQSRCTDCNNDNKDSHKSLTGWIIGIYAFMLSGVLAYVLKK